MADERVFEINKHQIFAFIRISQGWFYFGLFYIRTDYLIFFLGHRCEVESPGFTLI